MEYEQASLLGTLQAQRVALEAELATCQTDYRQLREAMSAAEDQTDAYRRRLAQLGRQLAEALAADPATPWTELVATVRAQRRDLALEAGEDPDARP